MSHEMNDKKISDLCRVYADVLSRQGNSSSSYARWSETTRKVNDFVWLDADRGPEQLFTKEGSSISFKPSDIAYEQIHKMFGTLELNPYERELVYGYPYVIGKIGDRKIRGPLLSAPVKIRADGSRIVIEAGTEPLRFNMLPFKTEGDSDAVEEALKRVLNATPVLPLTSAALQTFMDVVQREIPTLRIEAQLDGRIGKHPSTAPSERGLQLIDAAALFISPRTNWFLCQDLEHMSAIANLESDALLSIVHGAGDGDQVTFSDRQVDDAKIIFPFPSNRAQRRVALLLEDETTNVVRVEGPPGTGKSLTIANLASHLAASGKRVLITSQKDKALQVVDEKLQELGLAQIPMTMLRQDPSARTSLAQRLERVEKRRSLEEVREVLSEQDAQFSDDAASLQSDLEQYRNALKWESEVARADREFNCASGLARIPRRITAYRTLRRANRFSPAQSDELAEKIKQKRGDLLELSTLLLEVGLEHELSLAKRHERNSLRQLQQMLKRNQKSFKNFSMFERQKQQHDEALALLRVLPVWILGPEDVARLFPCIPNLFDVVIIDEASQVDLPSIAPILYRAKKVVVFGDSKQMQSRRFAFQNSAIATQAWQQFKMDAHDPEHWLHPMKNSLLSLAGMNSEEECLLDEHFRSLPPIIEFSNHRWYQDKLRIMTDVHRKLFGPPGQTAIQLHYVEDGQVRVGTQENLHEARALVEMLRKMVKDPDYASASIGVLCLFEDQVELVQELVAREIEVSEWEEHSIAVVNPDGFQGDERDVILYSLSWDNENMPRAALSARQQDSQHIQGMLNVAFTRARDEMHVFHSAPIDTFGMVSGGSSTIADWLSHCQSVESGEEAKGRPRIGRIDSDFEAQVGDSLRHLGVDVIHQYPSCGFSIDLVCSMEEKRVAVECDGEIYHLDEHGDLRIEDVERQAILERAGWTVVRIPYRKWRLDPEYQIGRVMTLLRGEAAVLNIDPSDVSSIDAEVEKLSAAPEVYVTKTQKLIIEAMRSGSTSEELVFRHARIGLGYSRIGSIIKKDLATNANGLVALGLIRIEEDEYFLTPLGREVRITVRAGSSTHLAKSRRWPWSH